jgi:uncharacterized damage-inducible protein DinB
VAGLTDEQARLTPTVSSLSLGGLVKHVAATEREWARFVVEGPATMPDIDWATIDWSNPPPQVQDYADGFRMLESETLAGLLDTYDEVALPRRAGAHRRPGRAEAAARSAWFEPGRHLECSPRLRARRGRDRPARRPRRHTQGDDRRQKSMG